MNTQHTPGPWTANRRYVETKDQTICEIFGGNREDARLIAAAPDLLKALTDIVEFWDSIVPTDAVNQMHINAHAAIAKATGEKP